MKKQKGITLIALVITIIVLLILAGVVINLTLGEHGILKQAQQAGEQYKISEILEKLELEKVDLYARKNGEMPTVKEYVEHLISKKMITESDVEDLDENTKNITVDGSVFLIEEETNGNIKITYQRKADNKPRIAKIQITKTTINSISVKILTSNVSGGSYKYLIKDVTAGETSFTEVTTIATNEYTFTNLPTDHEYIIQVELVCDNGEDIKETETIKTEPPKVTKITLDKTEIELLKGKTETITAEVLPEEAVDKTLTWTSSNEDVATIDDTGKVTGVAEGKTIVTVTSVNGISATCNVTVTLPPPPSAGAGGSIHTAKQIPYTWEQLNDIAKVISDNYGTGEGKINNDTAEVKVVVEGEEGTLGIGDWTTVKYNGVAKQVRILGFNHDLLVSTGTDEEGNEITISQYGEGTNNTYAGISFEFVDNLGARDYITNTSYDNSGGWGNLVVRDSLNSTIYNSLENKKYVKEVSKQYIATYNVVESVTVSRDKLWLLSASEIWNNGYNGGYGEAITKEGEQYKYYKNINANYSEENSSLEKNRVQWWLRSPNYYSKSYFLCVNEYGKCASGLTKNHPCMAPGFSI